MTNGSTNPSHWSYPREDQIASDLYRIALPIPNDGLHAVNIYIHVGSEGFTLIDAGWNSPESWGLLGGVLRRLGGSMKDVRRVLVTHGHRDHYTLGMKIRDFSGALVYLGARERPLIDAVIEGWGRGLEAHFTRLHQAGAYDLLNSLREFLQDPPEYARADDHYEYPDIWLSDGEVIKLGDRQLTAVYTPGHTVGHVVYADLQHNLLFGGDHLLPHITPSIGFEPAPSSEPLGAFLNSQRRMLKLPDLSLLPAHGPLADSSHSRAKQLLTHHDERLIQTAEALRCGATTVFEVACHLKWTRHDRRLSDLDLFNQLLAVNETSFHVDELVSRGYVSDEGPATKKRSLRLIHTLDGAVPSL